MVGNGSSRGISVAEGRKGMKGRVSPKPIQKIVTKSRVICNLEGFFHSVPSSYNLTSIIKLTNCKFWSVAIRDLAVLHRKVWTGTDSKLQANELSLELQTTCFSDQLMAQSIPSVPIPPGICRAFVIYHLFRLWGFDRKPLPGGGAFVNSSRSGLRRSLFNISFKKNMPS